MVARSHKWPTRACLTSALLVGWLQFSPPQARAQDLKIDNGRHTSTWAARKSLRDWDSVKSYGAERVRDRDRVLFQPDGVRLGNFILYPSVGFRTIYDTNILGTVDDPIGDVRYEFEPRLVIRSDLPRHVFDVIIGGKRITYRDLDNHTFWNLYANLSGRLDINHAHSLAFAYTTDRGREERFAVETPTSAIEQVPLWRNRWQFQLTRDAGRLSASLGGDVETVDFDDVPSATGNIDQDFRDFWRYEANLKLKYKYSPGYNLTGLFSAARVSVRGNDTIDRDAMIYDASLGLRFEANPLLRFSLSAGYAFTDYDQTDLDDFGAAIFEGEVQWLPTQLTTIYLNFVRKLSGTSFESATGRVDTVLEAKIEHELRRNLLLNLGVKWTNYDFVGADRRDDEVIGTIGLEYLYTKFIKLTASYEHQFRESNRDIFDLERDKFMFGVKISY